MEPINVDPAFELGAMLGRGQAFGLVANQSLVSQSECVRRIYESGLYKSAGRTWEQFCPEYLGLSRQRQLPGVLGMGPVDHKCQRSQPPPAGVHR